MRKKRINISILSIILILGCVLTGIFLYGREILRRESFNYRRQLSRSVHSGIAQAGRTDFTAFESANDSLMDVFISSISKQGLDSGTINPSAAKNLIRAHKEIYRRYFHDMDSVKSILSQYGMDTAFGLEVGIGFFNVSFNHQHGFPVFDSLLHHDRDLRTIFRYTRKNQPAVFTRGIRIRGSHYRVGYYAIIYPYRLMDDLGKRIFPLFLSLGLAFLAMLFFSVFTIRTMLKQQRISDQKTDFINNITHEFNTPLATIAVVTQMMQNGADGMDKEKIRSLAGMINRQNHILQQMISTIMQFAEGITENPGSGPQTYPKQEIEKVLQDFLALNAGQSVKVTSRLDFPQEASIRMDPAVFSNVLGNILDNALKYRAVVRDPEIRVIAVTAEGDLEISISDNGIGMKKDQLKYIFDKFYRVSSGDLHTVKGMGLGLYFVKKNVEASGGKIKVESHVGVGSTFILRFPLEQHPVQT